MGCFKMMTVFVAFILIVPLTVVPFLLQDPDFVANQVKIPESNYQTTQPKTYRMKAFFENPTRFDIIGNVSTHFLIIQGISHVWKPCCGVSSASRVQLQVRIRNESLKDYKWDGNSPKLFEDECLQG